MNPYAPPKSTEPPPRRPWIPRLPDWINPPAASVVGIATNAACAGLAMALRLSAWVFVLNLGCLVYNLVAFAYFSRDKASKP